MISPYIGALPAFLVSLTQSTGLAIGVVIPFFVVQIAENIFVVPKVMGKALDLHPLTVVIALLVGSAAFVVIGLFIAAQTTAVLMEIYMY